MMAGEVLFIHCSFCCFNAMHEHLVPVRPVAASLMVTMHFIASVILSAGQQQARVGVVQFCFRMVWSRMSDCLTARDRRTIIDRCH